MVLWMVGCGPRFLVEGSICRVTDVKIEYQQEEDELDDVEEEKELDDVMEVEKKESGRKVVCSLF